MTKIIMYTKTYCPYCVRAKALLSSKGYQVDEINIQINPDAMAAMLEKSKGARTVPQIFINDQYIGGCDDLYALNDKGQLDELLES